MICLIRNLFHNRIRTNITLFELFAGRIGESKIVDREQHFLSLLENTRAASAKIGIVFLKLLRNNQVISNKGVDIVNALQILIRGFNCT